MYITFTLVIRKTDLMRGFCHELKLHVNLQVRIYMIASENIFLIYAACTLMHSFFKLKFANIVILQIQLGSPYSPGLTSAHLCVNSSCNPRILLESFSIQRDTWLQRAV